MKRKIGPFAELSFLVGTVILPLATSMMARGDFGLSVVVVPAYLLSLKIGFLTFGMAEYCLQGCLLILFCLVMGRWKVSYLFSFFSAFIYGVVLDFWMPLVSSIPLPTLAHRIGFYILGMAVNSFSIAFYFESYFPPQMYELLVKGFSEKFHVPLGKFKVGYDLTSFAVSIILSFLFFHRVEGIGIGSVVCAFCNGILISFWCRQIEKIFDFSAKFPKWEAFFTLREANA